MYNFLIASLIFHSKFHGLHFVAKNGTEKKSLLPPFAFWFRLYISWTVFFSFVFQSKTVKSSRSFVFDELSVVLLLSLPFRNRFFVSLFSPPTAAIAAK